MIKENLIDIEPKHLAILKKIFKLYIPSKTVWAYGSRVTWTANTKSDLDIIVFDVNSKQINNLKDALAESDLPFSVDVMNWEKIPETFKENIQKKYVVLQDKAELVEEAEGGIKYDQNKLKFGLIPAEAEAMVAAVLTIGAIKYAPGNWKKFRDIETRYYDACRRHLNSINSGEDYDPETGLPHSAHTICCLLFILQSEIETKIGKENVKEFIKEKIELFSLNNKKID